MGSGKTMKAWPIWALVAAGVLIIALAISQSKAEKDAVAVEDLVKSQPGALSAYSIDPSGSKAATASEDPVSSPAIVASPESGNQVIYAVQLYSFRDQSKADASAKALNESGIPAYIQMRDLGDKGVW